MDTEILRFKETLNVQSESAKNLKNTLAEKNAYIDELHKKLALSNTVHYLKKNYTKNKFESYQKQNCFQGKKLLQEYGGRI